MFSAERAECPLTEAARWAHTRSKIHDVYISTQTATAEEALKRIGELYAVVRGGRGNTRHALNYYCNDGLTEPDNNAAERALLAVCLGSDHGGERGALLYGLIVTCRLNGIDPEAYLRYLLSVLPG